MTRRLVVAVAVLLGNAVVAHAQDPVRLPGIRITAEVDPPGANRIAGVVRDTFGIAVPGAEVSVPDLHKRAVSDSAGKFRIDDVRSGKHDIRARKIGYAPQLQSVVVNAEGGTVTFELMPHVTSLPATISSAARGGLGGTVGDTAYRAIVGAEVRLLGRNENAKTDSLGRFFFPVGAGRYVVSIQRRGYFDKLVSVIIPADSGRHMTVLMPPHDAWIRQAWNAADLNRRLALNMEKNQAAIFLRADLEKYGWDWATDAVDRGLGMAGASTGLPAGCYATLDGGPGGVEIGRLTTDEIEVLEVYPNASRAQRVTPRPGKINNIGGTRGVADSRDAVRLPMGNRNEAAFFNQSFVKPPCPIVYVWLRR